ncbi:hypothetical protein A2765_06665 [Candidatus Kaiserbacteria bacterium RIFCSPHIGHO2_01_FULL_56_24]|uniref:MaoC-like domain-containing protein n=1 Tax=Candidatus Kaiserbacteria bacterium RIFCSPHIGHO2_01_FULL_56_24 TaxID=1798487 RepID=A0A1F6DCW7_9BACT|nr:MAG: hypothetical protein A2765_06665 [Candidatus Kaiserbacteria bacterium RIFCSPHIGHO2_01_FULL_56_24]
MGTAVEANQVAAHAWVLPNVWEREFPVVTEEEISAKTKIHGNTKPIHHDNAIARRTVVRGEKLLGVVASLSHLVGYIETAVGERFEQSVVMVIERLQMVSPLYAGALPRVACEVEICRRIVRVKATVRNGSETIAIGSGVLLLTEMEPAWFPTDFLDQPE